MDLGHEIERQERMDALERELAAPVNTPITAKPESRKVDEKVGRASDSYKKAFWSQARAKDGVSYEIRNALSEGVDSEGGYLVPMSLRKLLFLHFAKQMQCVNMHMYLALPMVLIRFR